MRIISRLAALLMLMAGCFQPTTEDAGATDAGAPDAGAPDAGVDAGLPRDAGSQVCGVCPCPDAGAACGLASIVEPSELCLTPRADADAEWLALETGEHFIAEEALYERVRRDLAGIRARWPTVRDIHVAPWFEPGLLISTSDPTGLVKLPAFDCFLRTYRGRVTTVYPPPVPMVVAEFEGRIDVNQLRPLVMAMPNVSLVEANALVGDAPDICLSLDGNSVGTYIFDAAGGDCPAGCTTHDYTGFTSEADGGLSQLGVWLNGTARPAWFPTTDECTRNL